MNCLAIASKCSGEHRKYHGWCPSKEVYSEVGEGGVQYMNENLCIHARAYRLYLGGSIIHVGSSYNEIYAELSDLKKSDREVLIVTDIYIYRFGHPKRGFNYGQYL